MCATNCGRFQPVSTDRDGIKPFLTHDALDSLLVVRISDVIKTFGKFLEKLCKPKVFLLTKKKFPRKNLIS